MQYYSKEEARGFAYYRVPKALFTDQRFKGISVLAKLLYGLFLDRLSLSQENGWFDGAGHAYIYFRRDEIEEALQIGHTLAASLLRELEGVELIERRHQGLGMPTMIYVGRFIPLPAAADRAGAAADRAGAAADQAGAAADRAGAAAADQAGATEADAQPSGIRTSGGGAAERTPSRPESGPPDVRFADVYYMKNKTEENNTESSSGGRGPREGPQAAPTRRMAKHQWMVRFREQLGTEQLIAERPGVRDQVEALVAVLAGACASHRGTVKIAGMDLPRQQVRDSLSRLERRHLVRVLDTLRRRPVANIAAYSLTALYNEAIREPTQGDPGDTARNAWMNDYE